MNNSTSTNDIEAKFATELLSRKTIIVIFEAGFFLVIEFIAVSGNSLICVAMIRNKDLRNRLTNVFILSLAVSDILMAVFCMPISSGILIMGRWIYKPFACNFQAYWIYVLAGISLYTMAVTAVNRYYRVVKPRVYKKYFNKKSTLAMINAVWLTIGLSIAVLVEITWLRVKFQSSKASCVMYAWLGSKSLTYLYQLIAFVLFFLVPSTLITVCYKRVFRKVREHKRNVVSSLRQKIFTEGAGTAGRRANVSLGRQNVEEIHITKTLFSVVLGFALCWTPVIFYEFLVICSNMFHFYDSLPRQVHLIWLYFPTLGSAVNAFIYGVMNRAFRKEFRKIFWCRLSDKQVGPQTFATDTVTIRTH